MSVIPASKIENEMILPEEIKQELHACEKCATTFTNSFDFEIHQESQCLKDNQASANFAIIKIENEITLFDEFKQESL